SLVTHAGPGSGTTYTMSSRSYFRRPRHRPKGRTTARNRPGSRDAEAVVFVKPQPFLVEGFKVAGHACRIGSRQHRFEERSPNRFFVLCSSDTKNHQIQIRGRCEPLSRLRKTGN